MFSRYLPYLPTSLPVLLFCRLAQLTAMLENDILLTRADFEAAVHEKIVLSWMANDVKIIGKNAQMSPEKHLETKNTLIAPVSETTTESFGQLVIQGILLIRFDFLVEKDDFNSFGVKFQYFVIGSMCISFFTMVKAVLAYHNRTREGLRTMFSISSLFTALMFVIILLAKIIVYMYGFQNSPGLFFVPVVVKIALTWILMTKFEPNFSSMMPHDKLVYLFVSFLVPISIPAMGKKKKMGPNYGISLILFYLECSCIVLYAVLIKRHYHFDLFRKFYANFPEKLQLSKYDFEEVSFFLFILCLATALIAGVLRCLASGRFHPSYTLFEANSSNSLFKANTSIKSLFNSTFKAETSVENQSEVETPGSVNNSYLPEAEN